MPHFDAARDAPQNDGDIKFLQKAKEFQKNSAELWTSRKVLL
jgi:hypothetical protein